MHSLHIIPGAKKDLDRLPFPVVQRIAHAIKRLQDNPRGMGTIKLTGDEGYRVRVGDYRSIYRIDDRQKIVFIYRVRHRKDAYR